MNIRTRQSTLDPADGAGYAELHRTHFDDGVPCRITLLVPTRLQESILAEDRAAREKRRAEAEQLQRAAAASPPPASTSAHSRREQERAHREAQRATQERLWQTHVQSARSGKRRHPIFDTEQALKLFDLLQRYHKDDRERLQRLYDNLATAGHVRGIAQASDVALRQLAAQQPHMAEVVEFVQDHLRLAKRARKPARIPPILLDGEPGVGKTHFAQSLAQALRAPLRIQCLDSDVTGALLLGSDRKWSTSQHGLLFDLIALGEVANPIIVLDEIDKVNRIDNRVQSSLYSLLEPVTASRVRDISVDFEFDASLVTWIATANDATRLDAPLLSRFRRFQIKVPTAEQCITIAREVMVTAIRSAAVPGFSLNTHRLESALAHLTAREIQQLTHQAIARALKNGRTFVDLRDFPAAALGLQGDPARTTYLH